jgi:hypothetical protein
MSKKNSFSIDEILVARLWKPSDIAFLRTTMFEKLIKYEKNNNPNTLANSQKPNFKKKFKRLIQFS